MFIFEKTYEDEGLVNILDCRSGACQEVCSFFIQLRMTPTDFGQRVLKIMRSAPKDETFSVHTLNQLMFDPELSMHFYIVPFSKSRAKWRYDVTVLPNDDASLVIYHDSEELFSGTIDQALEEMESSNIPL